MIDKQSEIDRLGEADRLAKGERPSTSLRGKRRARFNRSSQAASMREHRSNITMLIEQIDGGLA
ncbi:hypothetical protein JQ615_30970 [Bradyrhizobium jicamae]|uniref:Uncharacterized protein n=1 Tax=Bradyrhizobium jicamae TaxID=280332 RepID=A0ABS5FSK2_9BRAD|nr:hypothetical protein [Bradyrhizobium jicamae]MBR0799803.1 hypothetical protein [Bradyrhizobium jicamae]